MSAKKKQKTKILVIGGQGYIGSVLCEDLIKKKNLSNHINR